MVSNQQFRLKWNNHRNTVLQEFETLLHNNSFVDCTIGADGKYLKAHKIVLSACSPYFQNVFNEHFDKHPVILLKDVSFKELKCMIDYMYCGEVNISECELPSFLRTAQSLKIKGLAEDLSDYDSSSDNDHAEQSNLFSRETNRKKESNLDSQDDEPPVKKGSSSLISADANNSPVSRKRKTADSVPVAGKSNASNLSKVDVTTSNVSSNYFKVGEVSSSNNISETETERTVTASVSAIERSVENIIDNIDVNTKKVGSPSDSQECKLKDVKEEPVDTDADNEDNSSFECMNNPCEDPDQLNEDSESNCTNPGKKFEDVSTGNVSYNESDANGRRSDDADGVCEEPKLGKGCRIRKTKKERYGEDRFMYEYEYEANNGGGGERTVVNRTTNDQVSRAARKTDNKDVVKITRIRRFKSNSSSPADGSTPHHRSTSSLTKENSSVIKGSDMMRAVVAITKPKYPCDECGKFYRRKEGLATHKRLYCGRQPQFECPHCDKRTFQKINLDTHISTYHAHLTISQ